MPGGPSQGCWNEGRCYGNGRQGLGGGTGPGRGQQGPAVAVVGRWRSAARPSAVFTTRPRCFNTATVRPLLGSDPGPSQDWTHLLLFQPPPFKSPSSPLAEDFPQRDLDPRARSLISINPDPSPPSTLILPFSRDIWIERRGQKLQELGVERRGRPPYSLSVF